MFLLPLQQLSNATRKATTQGASLRTSPPPATQATQKETTTLGASLRKSGPQIS